MPDDAALRDSLPRDGNSLDTYPIRDDEAAVGGDGLSRMYQGIERNVGGICNRFEPIARRVAEEHGDGVFTLIDPGRTAFNPEFDLDFCCCAMSSDACARDREAPVVTALPVADGGIVLR